MALFSRPVRPDTVIPVRLFHQRQTSRRLPSCPHSSPYTPSSRIQTFRTTAFCRATSPLFPLSALSHSRENRWLSKASGIAISEYSPQIHLLRAEAELAQRTSLPKSTQSSTATSSAPKYTTTDSSAKQDRAGSKLADTTGDGSADSKIVRGADLLSNASGGSASRNTTPQRDVMIGSMSDAVHQRYDHEIRVLESKLERTTAALIAEKKRIENLQSKRPASRENSENLALWSVLGWGICIVLGWREMSRWGSARTAAEGGDHLVTFRSRSSEPVKGSGDGSMLGRPLHGRSHTAEETRRFGSGWFWAA